MSLDKNIVALLSGQEVQSLFLKFGGQEGGGKAPTRRHDGHNGRNPRHNDVGRKRRQEKPRQQPSTLHQSEPASAKPAVVDEGAARGKGRHFAYLSGGALRTPISHGVGVLPFTWLHAVFPR